MVNFALMIRGATTKAPAAASENVPSRSPRLRELDAALKRDPDCIAALAERAGLLREQGRFEEAKRAYLELIRRNPTDFAALNDFGALALQAGHSEAARSLFGEAVRHHPGNANGHVNLANLLLAIGELDEARLHFEAALRSDADHIHAHRGLGNLLAGFGDAAGARRHRDRGFAGHALTALPYRGEGTPISVLLLVSASGGNIPTSSLLDDRTFKKTVLVAEYYDPKAALPAHDFVFNSIGDGDICGEGLEAACALVAQTKKPVINHPARVLQTGRAANVDRLRGLPNVIVPRMRKLSRHALAAGFAAETAAANGFSFPLLARAPGFHTGRHFVRAETPEELAAATADFPGDDVWLIEQLDARDSDGFFRKIRVMIVDRKIYPLHLAISHTWKVHYFRADMAHSEENRRKDGEFLDDMARAIGSRAVTALERIAATLDLDYGGIDFAVNADGDVLFFEGNATMVMVPLAADEKWDYRRQAFDNVFAAVRRMLTERAAANSERPSQLLR
jgi:hypothetical protein